MATRPADLHRSAIDSLGRGTSIMVVGTILLLFLSLIGRVAVARNLSLVEFGDFNLGLSFAGLLSLVALLGLHQAVARSLAERADPAARRDPIRWTARGDSRSGRSYIESSATSLQARLRRSLTRPSTRS